MSSNWSTRREAVLQRFRRSRRRRSAWPSSTTRRFTSSIASILNHDWPTDVLSFVLEDDDGHLEGEVIISADTAAAAAAELGWPPAAEQLLYVIHGMLHLVGYRDKTPDEAAANAGRRSASICGNSASTPHSSRAAMRTTRMRHRGWSDDAVNADALFWIAIGGFAGGLSGGDRSAVAALRSRAASWKKSARRRQTPERFADILRHHERVALGVEMLVACCSSALAVCAGTLWAWQTFAAGRSSPWLVLSSSPRSCSG